MAKRIGGKINVDKLADAISEILDEYGAVTADVVQEAAQETAEDTVKRIKGAAPVGKGSTRGEYKESITAERRWTKRDKGAFMIFAEAPGYRIAHLLEKGHAKVNGGRVGPSPSGGHWAPAEASARDGFIERIKDKLK